MYISQMGDLEKKSKRLSFRIVARTSFRGEAADQAAINAAMLDLSHQDRLAIRQGIADDREGPVILRGGQWFLAPSNLSASLTDDVDEQ